MRNFISLMSFMLSFAIFNVNISAAEINLRIEGAKNTIFEKQFNADYCMEALQDIERIYNIPVVFSGNASDYSIYSINGINNGHIDKTSKWQGFILHNGKIIDLSDNFNRALSNDDSIVIYYGNDDTVIPYLNYNESENNINIKAYKLKYDEGITNEGIEGAIFHMLSPDGVMTIATTDKEGNVSFELSKKGYYVFYGEMYSENSVPKMVKTETVKYLNGFDNSEKAITRGEFACLLSTHYGIKGTSDVLYHDVDNDNPFYNYVMALSSKGIMVGYGDGSFGVDKPINIYEASAIIERIQNKYVAPNKDIENIPDWALKGVTLMINEGIFEKDTNFNDCVTVDIARKMIENID